MPKFTTHITHSSFLCSKESFQSISNFLKCNLFLCIDFILVHRYKFRKSIIAELSTLYILCNIVYNNLRFSWKLLLQFWRYSAEIFCVISCWPKEGFKLICSNIRAKKLFIFFLSNISSNHLKSPRRHFSDYSSYKVFYFEAKSQ